MLLFLFRLIKIRCFLKGDDKERSSRGEKGPKFIPEAEIKEKGMPGLGFGGPAQNVKLSLSSNSFIGSSKF